MFNYRDVDFSTIMDCVDLSSIQNIDGMLNFLLGATYTKLDDNNLSQERKDQIVSRMLFLCHYLNDLKSQLNEQENVSSLPRPR